VFEAFYRASITGGISGTGLGLAIVRHCIDRRGGRAGIEGELGKDTRLTVALPESR